MPRLPVRKKSRRNELKLFMEKSSWNGIEIVKGGFKVQALRSEIPVLFQPRVSQLKAAAF
jgi:hypothetical protein